VIVIIREKEGLNQAIESIRPWWEGIEKEGGVEEKDQSRERA